MVTGFEFATASRIIFGDGKILGLASAVKPFGSRALLVCGSNPQRAQLPLKLLNDAGIGASVFRVANEPTIVDAQRGAAVARSESCDVIIGFGGGSALDAAKAIAALTTNTSDIFEYLEVIGRAQPMNAMPSPVIAIPTTAGTGSEVTRNAVLSSREHHVKVSLRSAGMLPRVALVDPELTRDLPSALTASTGMDALTQLIEPFVSIRANAMTDALCREGIPRAARALPRAYQDGADSDARREMALASLFGGMALANAGLGAVHGFAAPIGGMFSVPHGAICAALLADCMEMNVRAATVADDHVTVARFDELAYLLTGNKTAKAPDAVAFVRDLRGQLNIPRLRNFGIEPSDFAEITNRAAQASSMKGNPVALAKEQLMEILEHAW